MHPILTEDWAGPLERAHGERGESDHEHSARTLDRGGPLWPGNGLDDGLPNVGPRSGHDIAVAELPQSSAPVHSALAGLSLAARTQKPDRRRRRPTKRAAASAWLLKVRHDAPAERRRHPFATTRPRSAGASRRTKSFRPIGAPQPAKRIGQNRAAAFPRMTAVAPGDFVVILLEFKR
jgi:hypothetical protein